MILMLPQYPAVNSLFNNIPGNLCYNYYHAVHVIVIVKYHGVHGSTNFLPTTPTPLHFFVKDVADQQNTHIIMGISCYKKILFLYYGGYIGIASTSKSIKSEAYPDW